MNWHGTVGKIQEVLRDESGFCFEWKIPDIFSMPEKVGGVHFSPEIKFSGTGWYLGIYQNINVEAEEWIGIELWRSQEIAPKPVRFSLGIRKADGTEEQIYSDIYPKKCGFCGVSKFLHTHYLQSRKSHLAPSNTLTVSCTLWRDEPSSLEGNLISSLELHTNDLEDSSVAEEACQSPDSTDNWTSSLVLKKKHLKASSAAEQARQPLHSTGYPRIINGSNGQKSMGDTSIRELTKYMGNWTSSLELKKKHLEASSAAEEERQSLDSTGNLTSSLELKRKHLEASSAAEEAPKFLDSTGNWTSSLKVKTDDLEASSAAEESYQSLDSTAKMVVSRETQTEVTMDAFARHEECAHCDKEGKSVVSRKTQTEDALVAGPSGHERKRFDSHEAQTEDVLGASASGEGLSHLDIEGVFTLRKHYEDLLLSGDDHDVIIKVKNQEFRAHKNVLRARSPVFAAMFKHRMKENIDGSITIEDCDPEAFGEFLHYVYTGVVENLSPSKAIGLYHTGDKYDFPGLKVMSIEFLKASLSTTAICDIIPLAIRYNENDLLEQAMDFFSEHLEEIMDSDEWNTFLPDNYLLANKLVLKAMKQWRNQSGDFSAKTPPRS